MVAAFCEMMFFALPYKASTTDPMLVIISLPFVKDRSSELVSWISRWPFPWSKIPSNNDEKK